MIDELDLEELRSAILTGVTIGIGSQILIFENGVTIIIQCPFKCDSENGEHWGHGEDAATGALIFGFLNNKVRRAFLEEMGVLVLEFGSKDSLRIVPDSSGLESYVLTTRFGVSPVLIE